jgi:dihydrofolate reductase
MTTGGSWKAIAAVSQNGVIGKNGDLPWRLPNDLKWFKKITMGHILLMGRKTWESLPGPLPGRENWVLSRSMEAVDGVRILRSLDEVKRELEDRTLFIMGGGELYALTLKDCHELYLTDVNQVIEDGDAFFPEYSDLFSPDETLHECEEFKLRRWVRYQGSTHSE